MKKFVVLPFAVALLSTSLVQAQSPAPRETHAARATARTQEFIFTDELVRGAVVSPLESTSRGNRHMRGISLLRIRQHFVQEMNETVENL